eukprot:1554312-Pleurochrysis_carterae.AAC.1
MGECAMCNLYPPQNQRYALRPAGSGCDAQSCDEPARLTWRGQGSRLQQSMRAKAAVRVAGVRFYWELTRRP